MKDENKFLLGAGLLMWLAVVIAAVIALTGCCGSNKPPPTYKVHPMGPQFLPEIGKNINVAEKEWDGSKGQFPPG